ncbi:hypothetical protein EGW08_005549 [Elysia chlorotica]|uniref:Uncharacterized protein n=1 Tax=Elysia chlorotica TaxID=188477 RepID=A0A3S0ZZ80_ELYCH|nr:hypothetical protein EGW08_005549 [Elysia chlorotica]
MNKGWGITSKKTHGLPHPPEVRKFQELIDANATSILYYSLAGQTDRSRGVVTRLAAGPLLTEMVDQARAVVAGHGIVYLSVVDHPDEEGGVVNYVLIQLQAQVGSKGGPLVVPESERLQEGRQGAIMGRVEAQLEDSGKMRITTQVQKIRGQSESFVRWEDFERCVGPYLIRKDEMEAVCASDILERIAQVSPKGIGLESYKSSRVGL